MPDDPFAGLGLDRTVIMPAPGGRVAPGRQAAPEPVVPVEASTVASGLNPLVAAANLLLNVIPPLRASMEHPNPAALPDSLAQGVREFETPARASGLPTGRLI